MATGCTARNPAYRDFDRTAEPPDATEGDRAEEEADAGIAGPDLAMADLALAMADVALVDRLVVADGGADSAVDASTLSVGLVAYFPLDEGSGSTTADGTGNGNTGMLVEHPTWVAGFPSAKFPTGTSLLLDGQKDFVELQIRTIPDVSAPKTIALWFWYSGPFTTGRRDAVALTNQSAATGIHVGLERGYAAAWRWSDTTPYLISAASPAKGWHHLAYTTDGTTHRLYLDGSLVDSTTVSIPPAVVAKARLGSYDRNSEMFAGQLDDVRIYSRPLTANEIVALAAGER